LYVFTVSEDDHVTGDVKKRQFRARDAVYTEPLDIGLKYVKIIELKARKQAKKFGYMEHTYTAKLKDVRSNKAHVNVLPEVFKELETYLKKAVLYEDGDKFDIIIDNPNFFTPLSTGYH